VSTAADAAKAARTGPAKRIVSFGETLWDLLPTGKVLGGAPFNFAYRAKSLGYDSVMVTQLGTDELGREAHRRIEELRMRTDFVFTTDAYPTGTVEVSLDEANNPDYRIVPEVAYDYIELTDELLELARSAACICYGSLGQRNETSRSTLARMLEEFTGTYRLLDINLRKECWTPEILRFSIARSDILKLNQDEAPEVARLYGYRLQDVRAAAEAVILEHGLSYVVVTLGEKGACAVAKDGSTVVDGGYAVELVDPLGSGDAFAAGFVTSLLEGESMERACRVGNGMGAYVATQRGATQPFTIAQLEEFMEKCEKKEITEADLQF
jgi:fructokinase